MSTSAANENVIDGPHVLFDGSFVLEFLKPDHSRNASVLMRVTYKHGHPLCKTGKKHPQSPPYHLHFDQIESFEVLSGTVGHAAGWSYKEKICTPQDGVVTIEKWIPHTFYPDPDATEDAVLLLWAWPKGTGVDMDVIFFRCLLMYLSDVQENKKSLQMLPLMYLMHVTASTLVMFPTARWLGPLRWWIPWTFQGGCAALAKLLGYEWFIEDYASEKDRKKFQELGKSD